MCQRYEDKIPGDNLACIGRYEELTRGYIGEVITQCPGVLRACVLVDEIQAAELCDPRWKLEEPDRQVIELSSKRKALEDLASETLLTARLSMLDMMDLVSCELHEAVSVQIGGPRLSSLS